MNKEDFMERMNENYACRKKKRAEAVNAVFYPTKVQSDQVLAFVDTMFEFFEEPDKEDRPL